jgi:D-arginine dehydrogenase
MSSHTADFLVIGGGIAGASAAAHLAIRGSVILIEREAHLGYHATGRSAALLSEIYGNRTIRALTRVSRNFYETRPGSFSKQEILSPRGFLLYASPGQESLIQALWAKLSLLDTALLRLNQSEALALVPVLRPEAVTTAVYEPNAMDIDVHELHGSYLNLFRQRGGKVVVNAQVMAMSLFSSWKVQTAAGEFSSAIVVNAAGAWADEIATLAGVPPIGLMPKRRTAATVAVPPEINVRHWPLTCDVGETSYFKPEGGKLLVSPADETPMPPCDAQPADLDVAIAIDRLERATTIAVRRVERKWAGLRTFARDNVPVLGFDPLCTGFFWLAGQGGYGVETAEAMARSAAMLIDHRRLPEEVAKLGLNEATISPARFRNCRPSQH